LPDNYLVVDFGPHGGGHGHPDKLNIVWWAYRTLMAPDPGSIAYGNPMHGGYYRQTLAHNTVVVDGQSQKPCTGELVFFAAGENVAIGCAKANAAYPPVELTRVVAVSGQRVLDVFVAADAKPHRYELVYRNQGEMQSDLEWQPLDKEPEGAGYSWCEKWQQARADAPFTVRWNLGEGKGVVLRHIPQGNETLLTALGHDQPATTLVPFLLERVEDKVAVWVNALQAFSGEAPRLEVRVLTLPRDERGAPRAVALEADDGAHRDVLLVTLDGDELAAGPYRLRGRAALLHYGNGRLAAVLCADGSEVWANGERLK
ncbi:MAG: heparinase II/III family protein, partial [Armatimonadetes bacterium]|nr:heparinase II/III family protein [Armatimonadota bacterium]